MSTILLLIGIGLSVAVGAGTPAFPPDVPAWQVLSPQPGTTVSSGQLFVVARVSKGVEVRPSSLQVLLDGVDVTDRAQFAAGMVRLLYERPMRGGTHAVELHARGRDGAALPVQRWTFVVEGGPVVAAGAAVAAAPGGGATAAVAPVRPFSFDARVALDSRVGGVSGLGASLRQEPPRTGVVHVEGQGRYGAFSFPVTVYLTSDATQLAQPRNRFLVGVESKALRAYGGDVYADLDELILNGVRVRGGLASLRLGWLHLDVATGDLRRGLEGRLLTYQPGLPLPSNLGPDSTFVSAGTYRRRMTALRLGLGSERGFLFALTAMKSTDAVGSIRYGTAPAQNLVAGSDAALRLFGDRLQVEGGASMSLTTQDISTGPLTRAQVDSVFGDVDLPIDPSDYRRILILNASTFPLRPDELSSLAWYGRGRLQAGDHTFGFEYRSVGPAYRSFGNPFLPVDRRGLVASERSTLFGRRLVTSLQFQRYHDNLTGGDVATQTTNLFATNVLVSPGPSLPRLSLGLRLHDRQDAADADGLRRTDNVLRTYSAGVHHTVRTGAYAHGLNVLYTRSRRDDRIRPELASTFQTFTVGVREQLPVPVSVMVQYTAQRASSGAQVRLPRQDGVSGSVQHRLGRDDLSWSLRGGLTQMSATTFAPRSVRSYAEVSLSGRLLSMLPVELRLGYAHYDEQGDMDRDYGERYLALRTTYDFGF